MREINNETYSKESFDGYKRRAIVVISKYGDEHRLDIYTTNTNKESFEDNLTLMLKEGAKLLRIEHWCTKEQDDLSTFLIDEWLKE
jgi:hypothetical protein